MNKIGYDDQNRLIRDLLPEHFDIFNLEKFKQEVLSNNKFEEQIQVFDKYFNLFEKRNLSVITMDDEKLFSIYCTCALCKTDAKIYDTNKEEIFKEYVLNKFRKFKEDVSNIDKYIDKVLLFQKCFHGRIFDKIKPFEDSPESLAVSAAPKNKEERKNWTDYILNSFNEEYFFVDKPRSFYKESYDFLRNDIDFRLENALYPDKLLNNEIEKIKKEYDKSDEEFEKISRSSYTYKIQIEQFRELIDGIDFDMVGFTEGNMAGLRKVNIFHAVCYLRYLEILKKRYNQFDKNMTADSFSDYDNFINEIVKTFIRGYASKDTYSDLDELVEQIDNEQAYLLHKKILTKLQSWLADYHKSVGPYSVSKQVVHVEKAINSIQTRMIDFAPIELETKSVDAGMLSGLSNAQIVLLIYYTLKLFGLEPRKGMDVTQAAKIAHLLTGKEFTKINNSDFYQKFKQVPNFKQDKGLIEDLEIVKLRFKKAQLNGAVKMIDNEIDTAKMERLNKR